MATDEKTGFADIALPEKKRPRDPERGLVPLQQMPAPFKPEAPRVLPTKMRLSSAGSTTIFVIDVPKKECPLPAAVPVPATLVSKGPDNTGLVSALSMR